MNDEDAKTIRILLVCLCVILASIGLILMTK